MGGIMPKQKINDPGAHHASSGALIRRFLPYLCLLYTSPSPRDCS